MVKLLAMLAMLALTLMVVAYVVSVVQWGVHFSPLLGKTIWGDMIGFAGVGLFFSILIVAGWLLVSRMKKNGHDLI